MSETIPEALRKAAQEHVQRWGGDERNVDMVAAAMAARDERADDLMEALMRIHQWCEAYPIDVFPEPDFKRARQLLAAGGIAIDAVSASNMRHVANGIKSIAASAIRDRSKT